MSLKKTISIGPLESVEIYSENHFPMPSVVNGVTLRNNKAAPIRAINYWAPPIGGYNQHSYADVYGGEIKIFPSLNNSVYRYKVVVFNLDDKLDAEIEFVASSLQEEFNVKLKKVYMYSNEPFEIFNSSNVILPKDFDNALIKNHGPASIKAVNYWAGLFGGYNQYSDIDIYAGETKILASPPNPINYYKIVLFNLSGGLSAELEVISRIWFSE
ncbi:hypothetical protein [Photorhabdus sp. SF281]|uniref:hypothetical protein n=1 Tax=Photorhabdus sp. SF281 TaxID=3459527 RepID=UPI004043C34B